MTMVNQSSRTRNPRTKANGQGSIYFIEERNKWGAAYYEECSDSLRPGEKPKRRTKTFFTQEEALLWLAEQKKARAMGVSTFPSDPKITVSEYLNQWIERTRNLKTPATIRNYSGRIKNQIAPSLGRVKAASLTPRMIEDLLSELIGQGYSAGTVLGTYRTLSAAYNDGYRLGEFAHNPTDRVKVPKLKTEPLPPIPAVDAAIIYSYASQDPYLHARIEIGMVCGLRPGEVLGLKWSDIDWNERTLLIERQVKRVEGKGLVFGSVKQGEARTIALSDEQMKILQNHLVAQDLVRPHFEVDEGLLFPNQLGAKLDDRRDARNWKNLLDIAGVQHYARYQMRKTAYTNLYAQTRDIRTLMEYSGHTQVSTVMRSYVFPSEASRERLRASVDAARPVRTFESEGAE